MRGLLLAGLLVWVMAAQADDTWSSLWLTPDQRGEQLMRQGNPAAAARIYSDARRKAYAELQSGDYLHAARDFATFDDSNGNYNRGNALARAGRLQEAVSAYDAALARDPKNQDARYNRELVARALQKQRPQSNPSSAKGSPSSDSKNGNQGQADGKKDAGKTGAAAKSPSSPSSSGNGQQSKPGQDKDSGGRADSSSSDSKNGSREQSDSKKIAGKEGAAAKSPPSQNPSGNGQPDKASQDKDRGGSTDQKTGKGQPLPPDDSIQAQRDAAASLGKLPAGQKPAPPDAAASEQQLAQEQWLRRIQDDPGGLLRRKFMIEHMIRQQGTHP